MVSNCFLKLFQHNTKERTKNHHDVNVELPPTVAPIRATNNSKGMLKKELSASHVSARASKGTVNIKALVTANAAAGNLSTTSPCTRDRL